MLFLLQFSHKYTVRKKLVNGTSAPLPSEEITAPYPLVIQVADAFYEELFRGSDVKPALEPDTTKSASNIS